MDLDTLTDRLEYLSAGYAEHYGVDRTEEWLALKLTEEVGELVQALLTATGQSRDRGLDAAERDRAVADEVADVLAMTLLLARRRGIDVSEAVQRKWLVHEAFHRDRGFVSEP